jgi:hypothetical protein
MNKTIIAFALCVCCKAWGQVDPQVDIVTGSPIVSIPLYTIGDNELKIPLSLDYIGEAIPISTTGGWIGHNWKLSVEYLVGRTVRGVPDDYVSTDGTRKGWLRGDMGTRIKNYTFSDDNNSATCADELANWNFLNSFANQDTEPDMFTVSLPGLSFNFYFDEDKNYHVVPYQDVNISYTTDPTTGKITSFTILDDKGVKYICQDVETVTRNTLPSGLETNYLNRLFVLEGGTYNYTWKITKVESPISGFIDFVYDDLVIENNKAPFKDRFNVDVKMRNPWASSFSVATYGYPLIKQKVLKQVSSRTHKVEFESYTAYNFAYTLLKGIKISETHYELGVIKSFALDHYTVDYVEGEEAYFGSRSFLKSITENVTSTFKPKHTFEYHGADAMGYPRMTVFDDALHKDDWGFYSVDPTAGLLKKVQFPMGAYTAFFYEPHTYVDPATTTTQSGAGVRIRKTIVHDGINTAADRITTYEYMNSGGATSGKLLYRPGHNESVVLANKLSINGNTYLNAKYSEIQALVNNGTIPGPVDAYFQFKYDDDMAIFESTATPNAVLYERVTMKRQLQGASRYEFNLPAMVGDNATQDGEWQPSSVRIARPSTGTSICYEKGGIPTGVGQFPYPSNVNYGYARPTLKKVSDLDEAGNVVRTEEYEYQRLYANAGLRKIRAIRFEELPTYFNNGSGYTTNKMFLYGGYYINTDVKTVLKSKTEYLFNSVSSPGISKVMSCFYESPNHKSISRTEETNSGGVVRIARFKYVTDFAVGTSTDASTAALKKLVTDHRTSIVVESTLSQKMGSDAERFLEGTVYTYKDFWGRTYPAQQFTLKSATGLTDFVPSGIQTSSGAPIFQFDQRYYRLTQSFLSYDGWGNLEELAGRDRVVNSVVWGYNGTAAVATIKNATSNEVAFSDFETDVRTGLSLEGAPWDYTIGRTGQRALNLPPAGAGARLVKQMIANNKSTRYIFSCWIKALSAGSLALKFPNGTSQWIPTVQLPYDASGTWKYYRVVVNTTAISAATFGVEISSSGGLTIDDICFYPNQSEITYSTYNFPFGKVSETDAAGLAKYYTYDEWGRIKVVKDHDQNVISKFDYLIRP